MLLVTTLILVWLLVLLLTSTTTSVTAARIIKPLRPAAVEIEPNDHPAQANLIAIDEDIVGRIPLTATHDIDWFVLTTEVGSTYEVRLDEWPYSADYRLNLALYDGSGLRITAADTSGGDAVLDWYAQGTEYYLRVYALEIGFEDANYRLRVLRLATGVDACEINDSLTGTRSLTLPPGGPCRVFVGNLYSDLNFVPYTGQPSPNPDYFQVWLWSGRRYRLETTVTPGVDTVIYLFTPGATDDSQFVASDDDSGEGLGSQIEWEPSSDGFHIVRVVNIALLPHDTDETYKLSVIDLFHAYLPIVVNTPSSH
jgi:hypothetical protein